MCPPLCLLGGGAMVCLCPPLLTPHFYFPLELYVYITLTNNNLAFFHILVNYLVDNNNKLTQIAVSKLPYIQLQLVYIGSLPNVHKSRVCVPPTFWHLATPLLYFLDKASTFYVSSICDRLNIQSTTEGN